jgi:phosphoenolpyruvate-protein phosphotransferase
MNADFAPEPDPVAASPTAEHRLEGSPISSGIASGRAWLSGDILECEAQPHSDKASDLEAEMWRVRETFAQVAQDLEDSARRIAEQLDSGLAEIFLAHRAVLDSLLASGEFERMLSASASSAPRAVKAVFKHWESKLAGLEGARFRERADDLVDLGRRVLRKLEGTQAYALEPMPPGSVLVTHRLLPSDVVVLSRPGVSAILVESLGQGSHAALLAREKGIPLVAGLPTLLDQVRRGDELLVDAYRGTITITPTADSRSEFNRRLVGFEASRVRWQGECRKPAITQDGQSVRVEANLSSHEDLEGVIASDADGVGLFRLEGLYLARELPPSEPELLHDLDRLLRPLRDKPVTVRLLDIGGDKTIPAIRIPSPANPALGRRGVRLLLDYPQLVRTQLRALLRLSQSQPIRILVPLVTLEREMAQIRETVQSVAAELALHELPPLGAMIETPAAALTAARIAAHADFLCVGTNDLIQYTLAAGRDDASVSEYYLDDHPALLRLLGIVLQDTSGKMVTICGELAGREELLPTLLRLGFRGFSVAPPLIPTTKAAIRTLDLRTSAPD